MSDSLPWSPTTAKQPALARGFWILGDQAVVSLANFITTVIIARACAPGELGLYDLGFTLVVLLSGIPKALVWSPYTAHQPHLDDDQRARYTASSTVQVLLLCVIAAAALLMVGGGAYLVGSTQFAWLFWVLSPAVILMVLREHVRRLCLAWLDVGEVLAFDVTVSVAQVAGLVALARAGVLSGTTAYVVLAVASGLAVAWMIVRGGRFHFDRTVLGEYLTQNWSFGKWLFAGALAVLVGHTFYRWGLLYVRGIAEVEILASARYVVMVANPIMLGMANYFAPATASTLARHGIATFYRDVKRGQQVLAAFSLTFFGFIVLYGEQVVTAVYGSHYAGHHDVAIATALGLLSEAMLIPVELGHLSLGRGRFLCATALMRLGITLTLGSVLILWLGAAGVGYGLLVGNSLAFVWQWVALRRVVARD
jgi:O-antigen/teichoic acid export membrane protein